MKGKISLWIDPTDYCNLKCKLCYTKSSHANNYLSLENFITIFEKVDQAVDIAILHLNWRGEPLANPMTIKFIEYLNVKKVLFPVHLHTNGTILSKTFVEEISKISFAIDFCIFFSIDGGSREEHEKNRGANTYDKTVGNYNKLASKERGFKVGIYELNTTAAKELPLHIEKRPDVYHTIKPLYPSKEELIQYEANADIGNYLEAVNIEQKTRPKLPCFFAGNTLSISPSGSVYVCLLSHSNEGILGNIFTDSINSIMANAQEFRSNIEKNGRSFVNHCKNCFKIEDPIYLQ